MPSPAGLYKMVVTYYFKTWRQYWTELTICHGYAYLSLVSSCHTSSENTVLDAARSKMVQNSVIGIVENAAIVFHRGSAVQYRFA